MSLSELPQTTSHRGLLVGLALGGPVIAYGVRGVLVDADDTHPAELTRWVVGLALGHDLLLVPVVLAVGLVLRRVVPATVWPPLRAGLFATAVLTAVAWPLMRGYGSDPSLPSLFPRNYATGLLAALAVVWLLTAGWCALTLLHRRSRGLSGSHPR